MTGRSNVLMTMSGTGVWRLATLMGLVLGSSLAWGQGREQLPEHPVLTVVGDGEAQAAPDRAHIRLGANVEAESAAAAQQQVNAIMQRTLEALQGLQIPKEKIQTAELSIFPVFAGDDHRGMPGQQAPRVRGYRAANAVSVELDDLSLVGKVIDAGVSAGANSLEGLRFSLRDDTEARKQALQQAGSNARSKAQAIAEAMGVKLGTIHEIVEGNIGYIPPEPRMARMAMAEMATPIQPGQMTLSASITVTYRIDAGKAADDADDKQQP